MGATCCARGHTAAVVVLLLLGTACSAAVETVGEDPASAGLSEVSSAPDAAPTGPVASVEPEPPRPDAELRGDERGWFAPDTTLTVFGVGAQVNAHRQPGPVSPIVGHLHAGDDKVATGRARAVADELWIEVELNARKGTTGWVDRRFVGVRGATDDIAAEVPAGAQATSGVDALDLGVRVMRGLGYNPEGVGTTLLQDRVVGGRAVAAFDVRLADDAILGQRLRVVGAPIEASEGRFELERVERTRVCARGATDEGLCR